MNAEEISNLRLINQHIVKRDSKSICHLVDHMGIIQAQDFNMAKLAVGLRVKNALETDVIKAIDEGQIIRTHVMRPTWHFVSPENIGWMLDLSSERIKAAMKSSDKRLGIDESIYKKSNALLEKELSKKNDLSRDEISNLFASNKIDSTEFRVSHLLMRAELEKIVCSGKIIDGKQSYSLYHRRIPSEKKIDRDESLYKLAKLYFTSHGPATVSDFAWWSGLTRGDAKKGVELAKEKLQCKSSDGNDYWFSQQQHRVTIEENLLFLLPAFDEFIISYQDRTPAIPIKEMSRAIYSNGVFRPTTVFNGKVIGIWKRLQKGTKIELSFDFFSPANELIRELIGEQTKTLSSFWGKPVLITGFK